MGSSAKRIVFLGLPGAGKGTQAKLYSKKYGVAHISTGDMLRSAVESGSELGKRVKDVIDSGQLVSDDLIIELIETRVQESDCREGYILDGFPRTKVQGSALAAFLNQRGESLLGAIYFELPEAEVLDRLSKRSVIEGRKDDSEEVQRDRIEVYKQQTLPLVEFYRERGELATVDALGAVEEVQDTLIAVISDLSKN